MATDFSLGFLGNGHIFSAVTRGHRFCNLFGDAAGQDVRGAVQFLKAAGAPKVGVTGYCMGGALTLLTSVFVPEVDAAAVWYGYDNRLKTIEIPKGDQSNAVRIWFDVMTGLPSRRSSSATTPIDCIAAQLRK